MIDEPTLYDRALTQNEIASIFNASVSGKSKPTATVAPTNQVMWLAGDGNANDISGNNNNATYLQNTTFEVGKVGQSFKLDGTSGYSHIVVPDAPSLEVSNQLTLESWIKPTSIGSYHQIIAKFGDMGQWAYQMGLSVNNTLRLDVSGAGGPDYEFVVSPPNTIVNNVWTHVAATFNSGAVTLYINGEQVASQTLTITSIYGGGNTNVNLGRDSGLGGIQYFAGQIDEPAIYNRALSPTEIASIFNAGIAGKLKDNPAPTGANVAVNTKSDATVTFPIVSAAGRTHAVPLNLSWLPALPSNVSATGLAYDIATSAAFAGGPTVCFNLPSFTNSAAFTNLRILHLENNVWQNRTDLSSINFATKTVCTSGLTSLSPFAIVNNIAPTAAPAAVGGRVRHPNGKGIARARVTLTDATGNTRATLTDAFGKYRFDDVPSGATYVITVSHRQFQFAQTSQIQLVGEDDFGIDFVAIE